MVVLVVSLNDDVIGSDKSRSTAIVIANTVPTHDGAFALSNSVEPIWAYLDYRLPRSRGPG